jgi:hypothetical protein
MRLGVWDWMRRVVVFDSASCEMLWLNDACRLLWMFKNFGSCFLSAPKALHSRDHMTGAGSTTSSGCSRTAFASDRLATMFHFELKIRSENMLWVDDCWLI